MSSSGGKVRPGEPLKIPADQYNSFIDAASKVKSLEPLFAQGVRRGANDYDTLKVRNGTCSDLPRFSIVGLDWSTLNPSTDLLEWKQQPSMDCVLPNAQTHRGRFAVLVEPLLSCAMGTAVASGVVPCRVNVTNEGHQYASPITGQTGWLQSTSEGSAQILWKQPGTGLLWAFIRISNAPSQATTTTTSRITTTTASPCSGRCKWVWSASTESWSIDTNGCTAGTTTTGTTTTNTTTTAGPTTTSTTGTTCCPFNTTTAAPGSPTTTSTTTSTTTTTVRPCQCDPPGFCGGQDGDCVYTNCSQLDIPQTYCSTTTSTTCDCSSTTTASPPPPGCGQGLGCEYTILIDPNNPIGARPELVYDNCPPECPCQTFKDIDWDVIIRSGTGTCTNYSFGCLTRPETSTTCIPCDGWCLWQWHDIYNYWFIIDGGGNCKKPGPHCCTGTEPYCRCLQPTVPGVACSTTYTSCGCITESYPPPTDPCAHCTTTSTLVPTTTTVGPCTSVRCRYRWIPGPNNTSGSWSRISQACPTGCACARPAIDGNDSCEITETPCLGTTTTLSPTTTSSTTSSTTSTIPPCAGNCLYVCTAAGTPGTWKAVYSTCEATFSDCACESQPGLDNPPGYTVIPCSYIGETSLASCARWPTTTTCPPPGGCCGECVWQVTYHSVQTGPDQQQNSDGLWVDWRFYGSSCSNGCGCDDSTTPGPDAGTTVPPENWVWLPGCIATTTTTAACTGSCEYEYVSGIGWSQVTNNCSPAGCECASVEFPVYPNPGDTWSGPCAPAP